MSSPAVAEEPHRLVTWERRLLKAKKRHRPKLANWAQQNFYGSRNADFVSLLKETPATKTVEVKSPADLRKISISPLQVIYRVPSQHISVTEFINIFEIPKIPCVLQGIPTTENWLAVVNWNFDSLLSNYKDTLFKVGEDDDGYKIKVKMKYFIKYLQNNRDDSPLYVFDSSYDGDRIGRKLLEDYKVPSYFPDDLFSLVGENRRPPYRWFLGNIMGLNCIHTYSSNVCMNTYVCLQN